MPNGDRKSLQNLTVNPSSNWNNILESSYISKFHVVSAISLGAFNSSAKLTDAIICKTKLKVRKYVWETTRWYSGTT